MTSTRPCAGYEIVARMSASQPATDEPETDDSDDVEAHRKKSLTDELKESGDDSDDFELHRKRA